MLSDNVLLDLGKQRELVKAAADALTVDQSLNLLGLAQQMQSVTPGSIDFQTVPYVGTDRDDQARSIIRLEHEDTLHEFFAALSPEPEEAAPPTPEAVQTVATAQLAADDYNGWGPGGLGGTAAEELTAAGDVDSATRNADAGHYTARESRGASGDEGLAATVATAVRGAVSEQVDDATSGSL